jgi:hypothetical protein
MHLPTGDIHNIPNGDTLLDYARSVGLKPQDFAELKQLPSDTCPKCKGTGRVRRGLNSKRFKVCECTQ